MQTRVQTRVQTRGRLAAASSRSVTDQPSYRQRYFGFFLVYCQSHIVCKSISVRRHFGSNCALSSAPQRFCGRCGTERGNRDDAFCRNCGQSYWPFRYQIIFGLASLDVKRYKSDLPLPHFEHWAIRRIIVSLLISQPIVYRKSVGIVASLIDHAAIK